MKYLKNGCFKTQNGIKDHCETKPKSHFLQGRLFFIQQPKYFKCTFGRLMFSRGEKPFCKEMNISKRTYLKFREKKSMTEESLKQELEGFTCIPPKPRSTHTKTQGGPGGISSHGPAAGMEAVSAFFTRLVTILE